MATRRAYWKGYLKLSLVTCPVALYPASSQADKTHFHQINRKTGNPLRQQMVDEETRKPVDKTRRGAATRSARASTSRSGPRSWKRSKSRARIPSTSTPSCRRRRSTSDTMSVPTTSCRTARGLCRHPRCHEGQGAGGAGAHRVCQPRAHHGDRAVGQGAARHHAALDYEVRDEKEAFKSIPSPRVPKEMVELASHILDKKAGHFDPAKFKDEYELALRKLVKRKASGKTIERPEPAEDRSNVIDLMAALQQSLGRGKGKAQSAKNRKQGGRRKAG